ncbi:MAG: leucine-rich repeat domain-containing protein [Candidatus Hodarchaeota archaeon]
MYPDFKPEMVWKNETHQSLKQHLNFFREEERLNCLREIPDTIGQLTNLKKLDLTGNLLTSLPKSIGGLSQLEVLNLSLNHIQKLPESIAVLRIC